MTSGNSVAISSSANPAETRRYQVPPQAIRTIAALLALRDRVIAPILAGVPRTRLRAQQTARPVRQRT